MRGSGGGAGGWVLVWCGALLLSARGQETDVALPQGRVVGMKIYPESSASPVEIFLGIPFAAPPIGRLRFSAPARHPGWNRTLFAHRPAPRCLQPAPAASHSAPSAPAYSEDCLYLNVWTPQRANRARRLPVLVFLHSESWSGEAAAAPAEWPGQEAAAEGLVFVQPAYRLNVFGLFGLGSAPARGNLALLDQYFALLWVRENIAHFGGDPDAVTLLGHSAGAVSVLYHLVSPRTQGLFHRAIIMSPTDIWRALDEGASDTGGGGGGGAVADEAGAAQADAADVVRASRELAARLSCVAADDLDTVRCLQDKSAQQLLAAYRAQYSSGNWSGGMRAACDGYLPAHARYVPRPLARALLHAERLATRVPLLFGITDLEAINGNEEFWSELVSSGAGGVLHYATHTAIPDLLRLHQLDHPDTTHLLTEVVRWEYWGAGAAGSGAGEEEAWRAAERLARAESAARWGAGAALLAARLARLAAPSPLYVYRYTQPGGIDLRGRQLNYTGAAHGAELVPALGVSLLHALARRRATPDELRLIRRMRFLLDFAKQGSPVSGRAREAWPAYRPGSAHVHRVSLRDDNGGEGADDDDAAFWLRYLPRLANATAATLDPVHYIQQLRSTTEADGRLRGAVYALASVSAALAALLAACALMLRRAARARAAALA